MRSLVAAAIAVSLTFPALQPAACAAPQAVAPFQEVPAPVAPRHSYGWALAAFATGAGLIGASFRLSDIANRRYDDYLHATDPGHIGNLYDDATKYDRFSTASLIGGEALIAASLYIGFLRRMDAPRLELAVQPRRCALSLRF